MSVLSDLMPDKKILLSLEEAIRLEQEKRLTGDSEDKELLQQIKFLQMILSFSRFQTL
ncbi:MAG TPA: hypothetical protein VIM85_11500 [Pseudomonadales bacterium]